MTDTTIENDQQPVRSRPRGKTCWADRTDEILDTAAVVFAREGYQHTEMQQIADTLKVAKGTLYIYFPSKEDLFLKAVARGMQRLSASVQASGEQAADPLDLLSRAIHAYLLFFRSHPEYTELLIQERAHFRDSRKPTYFVHAESMADHWKALYADMIATGRVRDMPVERILSVVSDLVYGTMLSTYFSGRHKPLEEQAQDLVDIFFRGILSDAERERLTDVGQVRTGEAAPHSYQQRPACHAAANPPDNGSSSK
ncbi:MAG: TetR/AcrR family transcriptional regulator [Planctomycetia bacterium]|nr:TetR/AcrR family transcriptional regulator [Planctomycetia bacterium]